MNQYSSKSRKIIHIDMDCFYASVEMRENPALRGLPVAVGGATHERGVLSTCNYEARRYGLHSAMSTARALKKCPHLVLLPVNMALYRQVSMQIQQIFREYTELVEPLSLDEAYLDVTDCCSCQGSATWIAEEIRAKIFAKTKLTASAGVAPLKFLAKIASDQNKPDGIFVIEPHQVQDFVRNLPLSKIPNVGRVTTQKLASLGLLKCCDVQQVSKNLLLSQFGKIGEQIWQFSHGVDTRLVQPSKQRKSVAVEHTTFQDLTRLEQAQSLLVQLFEQLQQRLKQTCPDIPLQAFNKFGVKLKFDDFTQTTLEKTGLKLDLATFQLLLNQIWQRCQGRAVRLIGVQVQLPSKKKKIEKQMTLW